MSLRLDCTTGPASSLATPRTIVTIPIADIRRDPAAQFRERIDPDLVAEYCEAMKAGAVFPPVILFRDQDKLLWLADGSHRIDGRLAAGETKITADVRPGTRRDAIFFACGANVHGKNRSPGYSRRAVEALLSDPEWRQWPHGDIAKAANVTESYVRKIKKEREAAHLRTRCEDAPDDGKRTVTRGGKTYTMNTAAIGKAKPAAAPTADTDNLPSTHLGDGRMPDAGTVAAPDAAAVVAEPWADFEAQVREVMSMCRSAADKFRKATGYDAKTKQWGVRWANYYSFAGTLGQMNQVVRALEDGLPTELCDKAPGFLCKRNVEVREAVRKSA